MKVNVVCCGAMCLCEACVCVHVSKRRWVLAVDVSAYIAMVHDYES